MNKILTFAISLLLTSAATAYESSDFVKITQIRPLVHGAVYFVVDDPQAMCTTSVFQIKVEDSGSSALYSTLLAAAMTGKKVKLETWGPCNSEGNGWGTMVEGININF